MRFNEAAAFFAAEAAGIGAAFVDEIPLASMRPRRFSPRKRVSTATKCSRRRSFNEAAAFFAAEARKLRHRARHLHYASMRPRRFSPRKLAGVREAIMTTTSLQ